MAERSLRVWDQRTRNARQGARPQRIIPSNPWVGVCEERESLTFLRIGMSDITYQLRRRTVPLPQSGDTTLILPADEKIFDIRRLNDGAVEVITIEAVE